MNKRFHFKNFKNFNCKTILFISFTFIVISSYGYSAIPISNILELQEIGNSPSYPLNGEYELTQNIDASDTVNWNSGQGFIPRGTIANPFSGVLNGKGHKISGLHINNPSIDYVGLFGVISSTGIVRNLGIEESSATGKNYTSILAGRNSGTIDNCYVVDGIVIGAEYTGSLAGYNLGRIQKSYAIASVSGTVFVGNLVGRNENTINQCFTDGNVSGNISVGGIVGLTTGRKASVVSCYSLSSVLGYNSNIGGLVGAFTGGGKIRYSYSTGSVAGSSSTGGLIGFRSSGLVQSSYWDTQTSGWNT